MLKSLHDISEYASSKAFVIRIVRAGHASLCALHIGAEVISVAYQGYGCEMLVDE